MCKIDYMVKNKTIKLFLIMSVIIFSLVGTVGCTNNGYGYFFHYDVKGGNGEIQIYDSISENSIWRCCDEDSPICELNCNNSSRVAKLLGGKKGSRTMTFIAIPDEGYVVKEWIFNGKIVEGNKTQPAKAFLSEIFKDKCVHLWLR